MEEHFVNDPFDTDEYCGSEFDFSPLVEREIHVAYWDRLFKPCERKAMFFGELVV